MNMEHTMKVRIGYGLGNLRRLEGDALGALAGGLERNGFDSLWLSERISGPAPDPVLALAFAAARQGCAGWAAWPTAGLRASPPPSSARPVASRSRTRRRRRAARSIPSTSA